MRYLGMTLIFLAALAFSRSLTLRGRRRLSEGEGYRDLLLFMKEEMTSYARPVNVWCREFSSPALEENGFLPALRERSDLSSAYGAAGRAGEEEDACLSPLFSSFGRAARTEAIAALSAAIATLSPLLEKRREETLRSERVVRTLCASFALVTVILLL